MTAVELENVSVSLGSVRVLSGVSTTVGSGRFVGLVGPNGAGKTTLLRTVAGTLDPEAGTVRVGGEPVGDLTSRAASRLVATVPQEPRLDFAFTVEEVVEMGRTPWVGRFGTFDGEDAAAVERAMERAAVTDLADRPVTELSGGERQRVLLARALAQSAPVLLLDEPTASLDVNHATRTLELARRLADDGKTVIAAIHDLDLAARYCDELRLLADGRLVASGPPATVLTAGRLREAFDADAAVSRNPVTDTPSVTTLPDRGERDGRVHVLGGGRVGPLLARLASAGYEVTAGPLPAGDAAADVASALDLETVETPRFAGVDAATRERVAGLVDRADVTVLPPLSPTRGVRPALVAARNADRLVAVSAAEPTGPDGDPAHDPDTARLYERLCERGRIVDDDGVVEGVEAVRSDDPSVSVAPPRTGDG